MAPAASVAPPSLLLLPSPPKPATRVALNTAYRTPLTAVLRKLRDGPRPAVLVIALACPVLTGFPGIRSRSVCWKTAQSLLASLYTIISVICTEESIPSAGDGCIDARVVLVDHEPGREYHRNFDGIFEANRTVVLDLAGFASTVYPWKWIHHPGSEPGYELLNSYLALAEGKQTLLQSQIVVVDGGLSLSTETGTAEAAKEATEGYEVACLGGTFDHLHPGHKLLLHATALLLKFPDKSSGKHCVMIVGTSGDELLQKKKYADQLQSWDTRAQHVLSFLSTVFNSPTGAVPQTNAIPDELQATFRDGTVLVRCVNIHDPYGPTISEEFVHAIAVSGETRSGGQAINDKRSEKGWKPLDVYEIDVLDAGEIMEVDEEGKGAAASTTVNFVNKISSTAIRQQKAEAKTRE